MHVFKNWLLWGVETDEEVQKILEDFKPIEEQLKREGKWFEIDTSRPNPYMKPKSEWTEEMKENYENFKKKHL